MTTGRRTSFSQITPRVWTSHLESPTPRRWLGVPRLARNLAVFLTAISALLVAPAAYAETQASSTLAIAWLNAQRADNGIPAGITENTEWDEDCAEHMNWVSLNPDPPSGSFHIETPGTPGYTEGGAFAGSKAVLVIGNGPGSGWEASTEYPWGAANPWETAPIHLMQLLGADLSSTGYAPGCMITWAGYSRPAPSTPELLTYPANGTDFIYSSEVASESPFTPGSFVGIPDGTTTGPYLYVLGYGTGRGAIASASLSGPNGPVAVVTVDDTTTGPQGNLGSYLPSGGMIIPAQTLTPGATYTASATFAPNSPDHFEDDAGPSAPLSVTWSFTVALTPATLEASFEHEDVDEGSISASSNSPAPITVTVTRQPSRTVVYTHVLASGAKTSLRLPGAPYEACFTQAADGTYSAPAPSCLQQSWSEPPSLTLGRAKLRRRRVLVPLRTSAAFVGGYAIVTLTVPQVICHRHRGNKRSCVTTARVVYRHSLALIADQSLSLPEHAHERITVNTPAQSVGDYLFTPVSVSGSFHGHGLL